MQPNEDVKVGQIWKDNSSSTCRQFEILSFNGSRVCVINVHGRVQAQYGRKSLIQLSRFSPVLKNYSLVKEANTDGATA